MSCTRAWGAGNWLTGVAKVIALIHLRIAGIPALLTQKKERARSRARLWFDC
jgi:hypothetical protein